MASPHDKVQEGVALLKDLTNWFRRVYDYASGTEDLVKSSGRPDTSTLADLGFLLQEIERSADQMRKDAKRAKESTSRILTLEYANDVLSGTVTRNSVRGSLCTATPDTKQQAIIPSKTSPEFKALLGHFGVPGPSLDLGVLDVSWKGLTNYVTERMQSGKKLPPGITRTFPDYVVSYRRLRGSAVGGMGSETEPSEKDGE